MANSSLDFGNRYSGNLSTRFWKRVNALPSSDNHAVYQLGCALQDLEARVLNALDRAERKAKESNANSR